MAARPVVYVLRAEICLSGVVLANRPLLGLATVDGEFAAIEIAAVAGIGVRPESARTNSALVLGATIECCFMKGRHRRAGNDN
jgi:hypothetical protein